MAERRMFSRNLLSGDQFLDLSAGAQILYVHLCLDADDDGFTGRARSIMRMVGAVQENLAELISAEFLIPFESGVYAIRHWRMQNAIRKDRYTQTVYREEMKTLTSLADGSYAVKQHKAGEYQDDEGIEAKTGNSAQPCMSPDQTEEEKCVQEVLDTRKAGIALTAPAATYPAEKEVKITEQREDVRSEGSAAEDRIPCKMAENGLQSCQNHIPTLVEVQEYARSRASGSSPEKFFYYYSAQNWRRGKSRILDWRAAFRCWESREKDFQSSSARRSNNLLPIQQYSQRDYSGMEETMDEVLGRLEAG